MAPDPDPPTDADPDPSPTPEAADEPPPGHVALTRRELYEKVWSTPMIRLARTFRCSSTWLAQICADAGVPVPGRGYWARKRAGKRAARRGIPKSLDPEEVVLHYVPVDEADLKPEPPRTPPPPPTLDEDLGQVRAAIATAGEMPAPEDLSTMHPVIARTQRGLRTVAPWADAWQRLAEQRRRRFRTSPTASDSRQPASPSSFAAPRTTTSWWSRPTAGAARRAEDCRSSALRPTRRRGHRHVPDRRRTGVLRRSRRSNVRPRTQERAPSGRPITRTLRAPSQMQHLPHG